MRRHLRGFDPRRLPHHIPDVLVLGSGLAGLRGALAAADGGAEVLLLAKSELEETNTRYAQGGIAGALGEGDSADQHAHDTMEAARGLACPAVVRRVVTRGQECIRELMRWGAKFDMSGDAVALTREGGHSVARVLHAGGDATGAEVQRVLQERVFAHDRIRVMEHTYATDLLQGEDGGVAGALAWKNGSGWQILHAGATILATGGMSALYRETTNTAVATGDGIAMAYRAGAIVRDLEFIQFHPTVTYIAGAARSLVSEAVRGEGAYLRDRHGDRFMTEVHPQAELAPRDVVCRAIVQRLAQTGGVCVYLDCRHLDPATVHRRFPSIARKVQAFGMDLARDLIPVLPAAHYTVGGVRVDRHGAASVPYLFAAGEVASSGLHGANRLGSNSLLEGLVYGRAAGERAAQVSRDRHFARVVPWENHGNVELAGAIDVRDLQTSLRFLLWRQVGVVRNAGDLAEAAADLVQWERYAQGAVFPDVEGWQLQNQLLLGRILVRAASRREETRGAHAREDFPEQYERGLHSEQCWVNQEERLELVEGYPESEGDR